MPGSRCFHSSLELFDQLGDILPCVDALIIALERERADLLGNMESGLVTVGLEHCAGAGPQFPSA